MEAILSNSIRKLLWFEISRMLVAVQKNKFIVLFIIINFRHNFVTYWGQTRLPRRNHILDGATVVRLHQVVGQQTDTDNWPDTSGHIAHLFIYLPNVTYIHSIFTMHKAG